MLPDTSCPSTLGVLFSDDVLHARPITTPGAAAAHHQGRHLHAAAGARHYHAAHHAQRQECLSYLHSAQPACIAAVLQQLSVGAGVVDVTTPICTSNGSMSTLNVALCYSTASLCSCTNCTTQQITLSTQCDLPLVTRPHPGTGGKGRRSSRSPSARSDDSRGGSRKHRRRDDSVDAADRDADSKDVKEEEQADADADVAAGDDDAMEQDLADGSGADTGGGDAEDAEDVPTEPVVSPKKGGVKKESAAAAKKRQAAEAAAAAEGDDAAAAADEQEEEEEEAKPVAKRTSGRKKKQ
eukprot:2534-Heterococcus_DN1.PRE.1